MSILENLPESLTMFKNNILLWKLRDVLHIVNGNEIVGFQNENLSFQDRFEKILLFKAIQLWAKQMWHWTKLG